MTPDPPTDDARTSPPTTPDAPRASRRRLLAALGSGAVAALAGCSGPAGRAATDTPADGGDAATGTGTETGTTDSTATPAADTDTETETETGTATTTSSDAGGERRVLYLYGDVAPDGTTPSGEAEAYHQMRLTDEGPRGLSEFAATLEAAGFAPEGRYDADVSLTRDLLDDYAVLILGSNQHRFGEREREAVEAWVDAGGGLVAWSDSAFGGDYREVGVCNPAGRRSNNDLTTAFGMEFLRDSGAGVYRVRDYATDHYLNANDADGGVVFRGEGVSAVRTSDPARVLARLQAGGLGGRLELCDADAPLQPERDAALAVAEVGAGRVVGTFDRNTFWNGGEGTDITEADNREYARRLVTWAAGAE
jgi:hypothetical protein